MKTMKKLFIIFTILLLYMGILAPTVKAVSFQFTPIPNKTNVKSGDTIMIDLKLSDIEVGKLGINAFSCNFHYDETIFENVQIIPQNNWSITYNEKKDDEKYGTLIAVLLANGVTKEQEIGRISLKVREDAKGKIGQIIFTQVATNDGKELIEEENKTIKITVKDDISQGPLPQTGVYGTIILVGISIGAMTAIALYLKYKKTK